MDRIRGQGGEVSAPVVYEIKKIKTVELVLQNVK